MELVVLQNIRERTVIFDIGIFDSRSVGGGVLKFCERNHPLAG
jgi:hypothetical protein